MGRSSISDETAKARWGRAGRSSRREDVRVKGWEGHCSGGQGAAGGGGVGAAGPGRCTEAMRSFLP